MNTLKAEKRDMLTKAKKLRREGYVTGNIYGREMKESIPLQITKADAEKILRSEGKGRQVMLEVAGETYDALIKEIDFQALVSNGKVHSVAEVILLGQDDVQAGVVQQMLQEITYKALPADLVDRIKVDVSHMKVGETLKVKDLDIAKNPAIDLHTSPEATVATVLEVHAAAADEDADGETAEA